MESIDDVDEFDPCHRCRFVHAAVPTMVWAGTGFLGYLAGPDGDECLRRLWAQVGDDLPLPERIGKDGLALEWREFSEHHLVLLITLPSADEAPEPIHMAITVSPELRVLMCMVEDRGEDGPASWVLGEWTRDRRYLGHGRLRAASLTAFLSGVAELLGVPVGDAVNPSVLPLRELTYPDPIVAYFSTQGEAQMDALGVAADDALAREDWPRYEECSRAMMAFFLENAGDANGDSIMFHNDVATALMKQGKAEEAEVLAAAMWALCRRYRPPAHAESDLAIRSLALARLAQGDRAGAKRLLQYRVDLAECVRGQDVEVTKGARADFDRLFGTA